MKNNTFEGRVREFQQYGNRFSWEAKNLLTGKTHVGKFYPTNGAAQVALHKWLNSRITGGKP